MKTESKMRYYIVCPAEIESGGPELAHQLCHMMNICKGGGHRHICTISA